MGVVKILHDQSLKEPDTVGAIVCLDHTIVGSIQSYKVNIAVGYRCT